MIPANKVTDSQLIERFAAEWIPGESRAVERFLAENPQAVENAEVAVRLIYEDFCLRQESGCKVDVREMIERFPQWRTNLEVVLDFHELVRQ